MLVPVLRNGTSGLFLQHLSVEHHKSCQKFKYYTQILLPIMYTILTINNFTMPTTTTGCAVAVIIQWITKPCWMLLQHRRSATYPLLSPPISLEQQHLAGYSFMLKGGQQQNLIKSPKLSQPAKSMSHEYNQRGCGNKNLANFVEFHG